MPILQGSRPLIINTALGPDVLAVRSISVQEQLSRPFQIGAELSSENGDIDLDEVIGHKAAIALDLGDNGTRYFDGFVSRMVQTANQGGYAHYQVEIVPWLWLLTRTSDCRIFQNKTVPDIIEAVFQAHGLHDYQLKLSATYQPWEYCVQYRETDFNFVSRLMEEEGIYYFFEHEDGKHTLVLADSISAHKAAEGYQEITYHEAEAGATAREVITSWEMEKEVQPVACALTDFDFTKPKTSLVASSSVTRKHGQAEFEIFDYPGDYADHGEGDRITDVRLDEIQTRYEILHGQGNARGLAVGSIFELKNHPRDDQNREYLITAVNLRAETGEYASSRNGADEGEFFSCNFAAIPKAQQFRAQRLTPKPVVQGPQTAMVVGPPGEEIHTDKYGRVKVLFHWDRYAKADENSSCWVRVAQSSAGKGWGAIFIPRVGQEVMVEFLEGDPDMPIITGRVYNGEAMPPYPLPDHKTLTSFKSNSTKGGGGFNELRFEDKKGDEQIFMHGEKNLDIRIKNDAFETICNDRHLVVGKDQVEHVKNNRSETVDADHMEKIGKDRHLKVEGKEAKGVDGSLSLTVKGDVIEVFKANHSEQTTNDYYLKADNVVIEGMTNVTVKVGGSSIAIEASGIKIATDGDIELKAKNIKQKADMTFKAEAALKAELSADVEAVVSGTAMAKVSGALTKVTADSDLTLKGGMVKIN